MQTVSGFPYFEIQFNKDGVVHDAAEADAVVNFAKEGKATDLFVISHGWNNDMAEARSLYKEFFAKLRSELQGKRVPGLDAKTFAALGVLWPSKKFAEKDLIASGAASLGPQDGSGIGAQLDSLKGVFDNPKADQLLQKAKKLAPKAETDAAAAAEILEILRSLPQKKEVGTDDASDKFFDESAAKVIDILQRPDMAMTSGNTGGAAGFSPSGNVSDGGAAGFSLGGLKSALKNALNYVTYYQMKERAGTVGRTGVYNVLMRVKKARPSIKVHLIGHSFGGRLVTAVADGPDGKPPLVADSMTLLQAAFSHNGFAENFDGNRDGFFRKVVTGKKVKGPILITHSIKDNAVGVAYPIASKLSRDDSSDFGDRSSRFGGIGRNGAQVQFTPEASDEFPLGPVSTVYKFRPGRLYNLKADTIIMDHSDIFKSEIAHALLSSVAVS